MTAREEFNFMLNACARPHAVYNALLGLASGLADKKPDEPRAALLAAVQAAEKEGESR